MLHSYLEAGSKQDKITYSAVMGQCRKCFCGGGMISAEQLIHSIQQHEIDAALISLLGTPQAPSQQEAFPAAECDMHELVEQLDLRVAPDGEVLTLHQH